jgi:hypothetical protein
MTGAVLVRRAYRTRSPRWDHDHCEFCGAKFMEGGAFDTLPGGYATRDERRWVCPTCFEDFHARFGWKVAEDEDAG